MREYVQNPTVPRTRIASPIHTARSVFAHLGRMLEIKSWKRATIPPIKRKGIR
jgi:hypothetical protein